MSWTFSHVGLQPCHCELVSSVFGDPIFVRLMKFTGILYIFTDPLSSVDLADGGECGWYSCPAVDYYHDSSWGGDAQGVWTLLDGVVSIKVNYGCASIIKLGTNTGCKIIK